MHCHFKIGVICALLLIVTGNSIASPDSTAQVIGAVKILTNGKKVPDVAGITGSGIIGEQVSDSLIHRIAESVLGYYHEQGYAFAEIDSIIVENQLRENLAHIQIYSRTNKAISSANVKFRNDSSVTKMTGFDRNIPLSQKSVQSLADELLAFYENHGHPFAVVLIDSLHISDDDARLYMSCKKGPFVRLHKITVKGNAVTRDHVILREIRIEPDQPYQQKQIDRIPARLQRLEYIRNVHPPQVTLNEQGEGELIITVDEGNMNKLDGVVGYQPGNEYQPGYFTGLIDVALGNILGTGRHIDAFWERKSRSTQQLRLRYQEPWVLGFPVHIGGRLEQLIQDTSFVKREYMAEIEVPVSDQVELFAHAGRELILPDSIGALLFNLPRSKSWLINLGLRYDVRNHRYNPTRGVYFETAIEFANKKLDVPTEDGLDRFDRKRVVMDAEMLIPLWQWQTISTALHWRRLTTNEPTVFISDMFRMGGSQTLRGYREDEFIGTDIAWTNIEYRYLLSDYSRIFAFVDGGYFSRPGKDATVEDYKLSFGFGLRMDTRVGVVGVDYGLGEGRGLSTGLLHVRLVSQF